VGLQSFLESRHESRSRENPLAADLLDVRDQRHRLSGPREHLDRWALDRTGVSSSAHAAGMGIQCVRPRIRAFSSSRWSVGRPVRTAKNIGSGDGLVGIIHGVDRSRACGPDKYASHIAGNALSPRCG
jgi:hypothetical protein